ncbi:MAG TPA: glucose 1-dehydrogenase [Salegentibacter sp.]|uniref:SDR family NAD(P)-dependent oxidoreductase n=1 Tax=Salegentibacter sp. TaxID=1903072 RepID=UPI002F9498AA
MELKGKVALITGAGSGIGEATARIFAEEGAKVLLTDINEDAVKKITNQINDDGGTARHILADSSKPEDSEKAVQECIKHFGRLDIAVNNAGIGGGQAPVGEYEIDAWNKVIGINLSGVFYGMRYQIPEMLKTGNASIINVSSILGSVGFANTAAYVAAKHGVVGLTKSAALEYSAKGVRVNAVGPAFIKTPLLKDLDEDLLNQLVAAHPIGRLGESEEVAQLFVWLASDRSSFATGAYYPIDGGYLAQ